MLPVHGADVHLRHGTSSSGGRAGFPSLLHSIREPGKHRRPYIGHALRVLVMLMVLLPLWLLVSDRMPFQKAPIGFSTDSSSDGSGAAAVGGRRMKVEAIPLPGAALKNLILVAGHAVYVGRDYGEAAKESSWFLEEYQKVPGEAQSFLDHIRLGIEEAAKDPSAMLLFSGGQTRREAGPRSEGLSYWVVAEAAGWFDLPEVRNRTFTEEHARDSFENLLFSLCRFYELAGHYPEHVTVVSYNLKKDRFQGLHRGALRWPADAFSFVGSEIPPAAKGAKEGEARTVAAFRQNPYGCTGELLQKRLRRDPFAVGPIHPSRCPALKGLLQHCSPQLFTGRLPWSSSA